MADAYSRKIIEVTSIEADETGFMIHFSRNAFTLAKPEHTIETSFEIVNRSAVVL